MLFQVGSPGRRHLGAQSSRAGVGPCDESGVDVNRKGSLRDQSSRLTQVLASIGRICWRKPLGAWVKVRTVRKCKTIWRSEMRLTGSRMMS